MSEGSLAAFPTSEETGMSKTREYIGRHRAPQQQQEVVQRGSFWTNRWTRRIGIPVAMFTAIIFGTSATAFAAPVRVVSGDTFSSLVVKHCGTSNWKSVSFPGRDKNKIYAGETININCNLKVAKNVSATNKNSSPAKKPASSNGWHNPLPGHTNGSCNFWEWRGSRHHLGEDWPAPAWTPIRAAASGQASAHWQSGGAGNYVVVKHKNGVATVYMHMIRRGVSGWVNGGDIIGYVGSTGHSYGNHLHFEVQPWGAWKGVVNPVSYLKKKGVSVGC